LKARIGIVIVFLMLLGVPQVSSAQCAQTLSPGANLASTISGAAAGSTICLNPGNYGSVNLNNVVKASPVTVMSLVPQGASFSLTTSGGTNRVTFDGVTLTGWSLSGSTTKNIIVKNTAFTGQAVLTMTGNSNAGILIDHCTFVNINACGNCPEGRLHITQPNSLGSQPVGVTVTNSLFENTGSGAVGESDGIQIGAYGVVIGPGNVFRGIRQGNFNRHVDSIQLYGQSHTTITGNYFTNFSIAIMAPDGGNSETISHNVFVGSGPAIQLGSHDNDVFVHNTIIGVSVFLDAKSGEPASTNGLVRDNIFRGGGLNLNCSGCTITRNMFSSGGTGSNNINGSPTFVGGQNPTTMAGFALTPTSLGSGAASDGTDMGATLVRSAGGPPSVPTGLLVQ
jgi:hypothetical protein